MGIAIEKLPPWAQKQITEKLLAQQRERALREQKTTVEMKKQNKYHNTPTTRTTNDGKEIKFDSKAEANRFDELMLMLNAGKIRDLRLQQNFTLQEAYTLPNGNRVKSIVYKADFVYERLVGRYTDVAPSDIEKWEKVVEDVKGGSATKTRVYAMKRKLLQDKFGITIAEIE